MSGGHWDYQQRNLDDLIENLPKIIQFVQECLNTVDYALSGDRRLEEAEKKLFTLTEQLGDSLYG